MGLRVHLRRRGVPAAVDAAGVKRFARSLLREEGVRDGAVTLVLTGDREIRELNARFRDLDRPTDVLAFPLDDPDYLGDVVISVERAREQAPRFRNDFEAELARLIAHGLLHLLGHDHHTPAEGRRMRAAERRALAGYLPGSLVREDGRA
jgi:probable rRNA maturation factor